MTSLVTKAMSAALLTLSTMLSARADVALIALRQAPALRSLYEAYPTLQSQLYLYAHAQGFNGAYERLSTVVHEMIHVDSAAHQAYSIQGEYYAPYNIPTAWPKFSFQEFVIAAKHSKLPAITRATDNAIFDLYVARVPTNTLPNLADELNAYGQTASWLCSVVDGMEREKTRRSLKDTLRVTNAFLTALNESARSQYVQFYERQKDARNVLALVTVNAMHALTACGGKLGSNEQTELTALVAVATKERLN